MSVNELQRALAQGNGMRVLDVREPDEWNDGHVQGAASMSFKVLEQHLADIGIETDEQVAVMCAGGIRSSTACSILLRNGYRRVHNVTGGMSAWKAAELPTVTD
jgi:hydroxyacylglutathione hydrolase